MPYQLTPAQLELQAARRAAKLAAKANPKAAPKLSSEELERRRILKRDWVQVGQSDSKRRVRIVTWNVLAQTLVRRELFPGSDCLKWGERKPMLLAELERHSSADIICLQECDRLKEFLPAMPDHSYIEAFGPNKKHGLLIFFRRSRFRARSQRTVYLDEEELSPYTAVNGNASINGQDKQPSSSSKGDAAPGDIGRRRGGSRCTRNVGLVVALESVDALDQGIVIATTHLFWHPKFSYERIRQLIVLARAIQTFKQNEVRTPWPTILAGDLNMTPCEATYQLITSPSQALPQELVDEFETSRLVHTSVDKALSQLGPASADQIPANDDNPSTSPPAVDHDNNDEKDDDGDDDEQEPPDTDERSVAGTRHPGPNDGILSFESLVPHLREVLPEGLSSAYDTSRWVSGNEETFERRGGFKRHFENTPASLKGQNEPGYTCYTPLFKLTLDYLLLFPDDRVAFTALLRPAQSGDLSEGLPRKGICASDHLAVGCELAW
ncbi:Endonuclease/exonuclease/phosphatase [Kockovaella imperatae]|uniref:Endonuclease/exonuclease/phosphatase n=1 Tax=Kockovaella imperatae TaxID=4999 RepID=A0A1Y1UIQ1_9TREE|nr:Endonuclease/exonuclease/phosphatase [Kockovaella imperatae]ORX37437.1 Endonuclease/exonuclease/phosphatase [Kockovaella imperatae]